MAHAQAGAVYCELELLSRLRQQAALLACKFGHASKFLRTKVASTLIEEKLAMFRVSGFRSDRKFLLDELDQLNGKPRVDKAQCEYVALSANFFWDCPPNILPDRQSLHPSYLLAIPSNQRSPCLISVRVGQRGPFALIAGKGRTYYCHNSGIELQA